MSEIARKKFAVLMDQIETLEDEVAALQQKLDQGGDGVALRKELDAKLEQMVAKRTELTRVSDGCGTGHPKP